MSPELKRVAYGAAVLAACLALLAALLDRSKRRSAGLYPVITVPTRGQEGEMALSREPIAHPQATATIEPPTQYEPNRDPTGMEVLGIVINESYQPVPDVELEIEVAPTHFGLTITTDTAGTFRSQFDGIVPGTMITLSIRGRDSDWIVIPAVTQFRYEGPFQTSQVIVASSGACLASGRVEFKDGTPVPQALVESFEGESTTTDLEGRFRLSVAQWNRSVWLRYAVDEDSRWTQQSTKIQLTDSQSLTRNVDDILLVLDRLDTSTEILAIDNKGRGIQHASVSSRGHENRQMTDFSGRCTVRYQTSTDAQLWIRKNGYSVGTMNTRDLIDNGQSVVVLHELTAVSATVVDRDGDPVAGAIVEVSSTSAGGGDLLRTVSREQGKFEFYEAADNSVVFLEARTMDGEKATRTFKSGIESGNNIRLVLRDRVLLKGTVLDQEGRPLRGASVYAIREDQGEVGFPRDITNHDGQFALRVAPGVPYSVTAVVSEYRRGSVTAVSGNDLLMTLDRAGYLSGRVYGPGKVRVGQCEVRALIPSADGQLRPLTSWSQFNNDGYFALNPVTLGPIGTVYVIESRLSGSTLAVEKAVVESLPTYGVTLVHLTD